MFKIKRDNGAYLKSIVLVYFLYTFKCLSTAKSKDSLNFRTYCSKMYQILASSTFYDDVLRICKNLEHCKCDLTHQQPLKFA